MSSENKICTEDYIKKLFCSHDYVSSELYGLLANKKGHDAQLDPINARLINVIVRLMKPKRAVELGTLFGYSAAWIADALPSGGTLYTIDRNIDNIKIACKLFSSLDLQNNICTICGNALEELAKFDGMFDMLFIDADKKNYCKYLDWAEVNIKKGGLIISDNTLSFGKINITQTPPDCCADSWNIVREFNIRLADDRKYCSAMLPVAKGLTLSFKKF